MCKSDETVVVMRISICEPAMVSVPRCRVLIPIHRVFRARRALRSFVARVYSDSCDCRMLVRDFVLSSAVCGNPEIVLPVASYVFFVPYPAERRYV